MSQTYSKDEYITQYINAGYALVPTNGKVAGPGWNKAKPDSSMTPKQFPGNFAVVLQDDDLVIDIDPRNFPKDHDGVVIDTSIQLEKMMARNKVKPVRVKTSLGEHWYFKKPKGVRLVHKLPQYAGVDFQRRGHYVIGAGSLHPSGATYTLIEGDFDNVPEAPDELIDELRYCGGIHSLGEDVSWKEDDATILSCIKRLRVYPVAIAGNGGNETTFKAACMLRDQGLRDDITYDLMLKHYNPRCLPAWTDTELDTIVNNAYLYARDNPGNQHINTILGKYALKSDEMTNVKNDFGNAIQLMDDQQLVLDQHGLIKEKLLENVVALFKIPSYNNYNNPLQNMVRYNEFTETLELSFAPPWENQNPAFSGEINDRIVTNILWFFKKAYSFTATEKHIIQAMDIVGTVNRYHPIQAYLQSLDWDGKPRIDTWLIDYCGAEDSKYVRAVAKNTLISAAARVFDPGCQVDTMTVLEGPQGSGKSSAIHALGGQFYGTLFLDPHQKDTVMNMRNNWINEIAEMEFTRKAEVAAVKHFISNRADTLRLPYAKTSGTHKRQCIFIGTINPEADASYLRDSTGNRRFWPVATGKKINVAGLLENRDQIWAEARQRFFNGETWYMDNSSLRALAEAEQEKRREVHPWRELIYRHIQLRRAQGIATRKIEPSALAVSALGINPMNLDVRAIKTIGNILGELGYIANKTDGHLSYVNEYADIEDLL